LQTNRNISNNKPDNIILDNETGPSLLTDAAIPGDRNAIKKASEKILICKNLTIEVQHVWNINTNVSSVTLRATGTIAASLRQ
jgi:hypothetical protein